MDYNQNIYDVFNYRKNNFNSNRSIDDLLMESYDLDEFINSSNIEFKSTCYMEDLVLEAIMYEDFNETEIRMVMEEVQEKRTGNIREKLHGIWKKLKEWIKAIGVAVRNFFKSCREALRKAINFILGKGDVSNANDETNAENNNPPNKGNTKNQLALNAPKNDSNNQTKSSGDKGQLNTPKNSSNVQKSNDPNMLVLSTNKSNSNNAQTQSNNQNQQTNGSQQNRGQLPPPQSEDDKLRAKFKQSTLVVDIDDFDDLENGSRKAISTISKLTNSSIYTTSKDEILRTVGLQSEGKAYDLMRSYFMKSWKSKTIPVKNLDPVKIRNIINKSDDYADFIQKIENQCVLGFGNLINKYTSAGQEQYADNVNFGLKLMNSLVREAVHFLRLQIQVYTKVMTRVLKGNNNPEEKK